MARDYARIVTAIWGDDDWRDLTPLAQRMFMALLSQPKLTMIGVIDYMPERWAAHAKGLTATDIDDAISELEEAAWVFVDRESGEVLIRTFVRHDGSANNQKLRAPMWNAWKAIESAWLRREVLDHLPDEAWTEGKTGAPPPEAIELRNTPFQRPGIGLSMVVNRPRNTPEPEPEPEPEPSTPSSAGADGVPDPFDEFWQACPRKVGKAEARRKFAKAAKGTDPPVIIEAMRTHAEHWRTHGTEEQFIPHPATWLHQGRWDDELVSPGDGPPEFQPMGNLARNLARARGDACSECDDVGWIEDIDGSAWPCRACQQEGIA